MELLEKNIEQQIIDYFQTNRENTIPTISRRFNIPKHKVDKIINEYLKTRENDNNRKIS